MKLHLDKSCATCEFNIENVCTQKFYGQETPIYIDNDCDSWDIGLEYYSFIMSHLPWYFKNLRKNDSEILELIELDEKILLLS